MKKNCKKKKDQKIFRVVKLIKRMTLNYILNGKVTIVLLRVDIVKIDIVCDIV